MNEGPSVLEILRKHGWRSNPPAEQELLLLVEKKFGVPRLPDDYKEILARSNGGSLYGFKTPLIIYPVGELLALYKEHDLYTDIPESIIFGGDGGGTLYAFDLRQKNDRGDYPVFFVKEDDLGYDRMIYQGADLTSTILKIIANDKLN